MSRYKGYKATGSSLFFHEEFAVQHLRGRTLDPAAAVVVCTIQRLCAALRGQDLDEADEEASGFEHPDGGEHQVSYSAAIPPETFDLVIVDECHRSIYGTWRQVLDYFDAFLVGLTATRGRHTLGFFAQNLVSEYPFERSVADAKPRIAHDQAPRRINPKAHEISRAVIQRPRGTPYKSLRKLLSGLR